MHEEPKKIETLGGGYALKWDDETQMSVNAHAALLAKCRAATHIAARQIPVRGGAFRRLAPPWRGGIGAWSCRCGP